MHEVGAGKTRIFSALVVGILLADSASASAQNAPGNTTDKMDVSPEQARKIADAYLSGVSPGTKAEKPERFYGYNTVDTQKEGKPVGMLSVPTSSQIARHRGGISLAETNG